MIRSSPRRITLPSTRRHASAFRQSSCAMYHVALGMKVGLPVSGSHGKCCVGGRSACPALRLSLSAPPGMTNSIQMVALKLWLAMSSLWSFCTSTSRSLSRSKFDLSWGSSGSLLGLRDRGEAKRGDEKSSPGLTSCGAARLLRNELVPKAMAPAAPCPIIEHVESSSRFWSSPSTIASAPSMAPSGA